MVLGVHLRFSRRLWRMRRLCSAAEPSSTAAAASTTSTRSKLPSLVRVTTRVRTPLSALQCNTLLTATALRVCCLYMCRCRHDSTGNTCVDGRCGECKICQPDFDPTATTAAAKTTADKHNCAEWCDNRAHTHCNASLTASERSLCVCPCCRCNEDTCGETVMCGSCEVCKAQSLVSCPKW